MKNKEFNEPGAFQSSIMAAVAGHVILEKSKYKFFIIIGIVVLTYYSIGSYSKFNPIKSINDGITKHN